MDTDGPVHAHRDVELRGEGFGPAALESAMGDVITIDGGDGVPPEPNWHTIFGRAGDREAAAAYWRGIINEMRTADKLAVANAHSIKRLIVAYVTYDISAREVLKLQPVIKAKKTGVPSYNPWWTTMSNADSQANALEKQLCLAPRDRGTGAKVEKKARRVTGADRYLKPRG